MSIWGRRVDALFTRGEAATREDYDRAGKNALWQIALVLLVVLTVVAVASLD